MFASLIWPAASGRPRPLRVRAFGVFPAIVLLLCTSLLVALETPSKPFLERNSFYLSSAGFRVQFANEPAGQKALRALPAHRFVANGVGEGLRYSSADRQHCGCIFVGTQQGSDSYRGILRQERKPARAVSPDYKTQAGVLLSN